MSEPTKPRPSRGLDKLLEDEIQAAIGDGSLMDLADGDEGEQGDLLEGHKVGTVVDIGDSDVLVEFNAREQGTCPLAHFSRPPRVGDRQPFRVEGQNSKTGLFSLTLGRHASAHADWSDIEEGRIVRVKVTGHNTGGLEVKIGGQRGFIPYSHVSYDRIEDGSEYVDQMLDCKILEIDRSAGRVILSRRAVLDLEREEAREQAISGLTVGDVMLGKVTRIEPYGAFMDLGGVEGLLHVSNMDYSRVEDPTTIVELGQEVEVKILKVEEGGRRIALGMKQLRPDPWDEWVAAHSVNDMVTGKVTRIADYGAFVEVAPGVEGLLHIGQLATHRVNRVRAVVAEGQEVNVRVASIEPDRRRIGLSMRAASGRAIGDASEVDEETLRRYTKRPDTGPSGSSLGDLLRAAMEGGEGKEKR